MPATETEAPETEAQESENGGQPEDVTTVEVLPEELPPELRGEAGRIAVALNDEAPPSEMPDGTRYKVAYDVENLVSVLIEALHTRLEGLDYRCWFRSSLRSGGRPAAATTSTPPGRWAKATGLDFYIDVDLSRWLDRDAAERIRLIDHELCHVEYDEEDGISLTPHEIEEYSSIIQRWGPTASQEGFVQVASQLDLEL